MTTDSNILSANPRASYLAERDAIQAAVVKVLESGWYILGSEVDAFEREFASYLGVEHAVGVGNGTDAIQLGLAACGIKPGERVVTVSHTAVATVAAIHLASARPVLVDVDPTTYTMDPNALEQTLQADTEGNIRAVVPVHLYGHPAAMPEIMEIAQRYGLKVLEDCAQSHGAAIESRYTGSFGDVASFSFYPTKNLGAFGDGGACICNDSQIASKMRLLRQYGWRERYLSEVRGMNTRLDEIQAAILRVKLPSLDAAISRRREIAEIYNERLRETGVSLPEVRSGYSHVYHQYVIRTSKRDELRKFLLERGVATAILYPVPVHLQRAYSQDIEIGVKGLAVTERLCGEILSLPLYPELTNEEVERVCLSVTDFFNCSGN